MDPGGYGGGAFGGAKAGGAQDPLTFLKRPIVCMRVCTLFFSIIVFGCISSSGWFFMQNLGQEVCVLNMDSSACHFSTMVGIVAFLASIGFLVGEWFFEQMSSIKTRKHYVIFDMVFSGLWSFFFFVTFVYVVVSWSKTEDIKFSFASSNIIGAIFFAFLSTFAWAGCGILAFQRFKSGGSAAFTNDGLGTGEDGGANGGPAEAYGGYEDGGGQYNQPPFSGGGQSGMGYQQQPEVQY